MELLNDHKIEIINLCVRHKVKELVTFGSVLTSNFNKKSDVDFVVEFEPLDPAVYAEL